MERAAWPRCSRRALLAGGLAWAAGPASARRQALTTARYPINPDDKLPQLRFNTAYSLAMLNLALSKPAERVLPEAIASNRPNIRRFNAMRDEAAYDVYWGATSAELERDHLPIRICLMKGLNGWRVPVVRKERTGLLAEVRSLRDLRHFSAGQGHNWIDTEVLQAAGIAVHRSAKVETLYGMLLANRFDYLPRGLQEVWSELEHPLYHALCADTNLLIRYPNPHYFFVRRSRPDLAVLIEEGLEIARQDGSFDALFYRYHRESLQRARLPDRHIIDLPNPLLPAETPLNRKDLWFSIDDLKRL